MGWLLAAGQGGFTGNAVLSLHPGGGDALTRGLNEVRRKIYGALKKYIHTIAKWLS